MYGVVLWCDRADNRAVIWCEDQGELAYFKGDELALADNPLFDAGDLVQFDLREGEKQRLAFNPRRIGERLYEGLPHDLMTCSASKAEPAPVESAFQSANIIPFNRGQEDDRTKRELLVG